MDGFSLRYERFDPGLEGLLEALTSTGNGYLCTRGAAEWGTRTACTIPAPTSMAATTVRRPSWAGASGVPPYAGAGDRASQDADTGGSFTRESLQKDGFVGFARLRDPAIDKIRCAVACWPGV